jgi:drug/metabolite transporter (DMT)-like permease
MTSPRHIAYFVALGLFWGLSPSLYRAMGEGQVPVTHIIVLSGLGVGLALGAAAWLSRGRINLSHDIQMYGLGCAVLMNIPFALGLIFARHVPTTELALIMSLAPFFNYTLALLSGRENAVPRRLAAIAVGFASTATLILSREGMISGQVSWWLVASFSSPILYTAYNWFAGRFWPREADTLSVGAAESVWSGIIVLPMLFVLAPPWSAELPELFAYWAVLAATLMWVVERIAFFTLMRDKGPVYTVQAVYLATPAAVIFAMVFFGGASDIWLWLSLAILMVALYLNNTGTAARPMST